MPSPPYRALILLGAVVVPFGCTGGSSPLEVRADALERSIARAWRQDGASVALDTETPVANDGAKTLDADADLGDLLAHAALNNAGLEAAFAHWKAALERLPQVRAMPDPRFTYGVFINEVETRVGPQQHRLAITQTFPWFGELDLRESAAGEDAAVAYEQYLGVRLELFRRIKDAQYQRADLEREIEITGENIGLLEQLERIAVDRYRRGLANHADVIRLQIELEKVQDHLRVLEDRRRPLDATLNAALNREPDAPLPAAGDLPRMALDTDEDSLRQWCLRNNPELRAIEHRIEQGRISTQLARIDANPDLTFGLDYIVTGEAADSSLSESGDDPLVASVSFNLPLAREKYDAGIREAITRRYATAREKLEAEHRLLAQLEASLYAYRTAERQITLYGVTLIPKARQALDATLSAYQTGSAPFLDILEAQRELLELELMHVRALAARARELAQLDALTGVDLPRTPDPASPPPDETSESP
jgi:outer membrane protein TolC